MRRPLALLAALAALIIAGPIAAQAADFTPAEAGALFGTRTGDPFTSVFLNQLFGPLFPSVSGSHSETVFSSIIGYFNVIVLVIGGGIFFWNMSVGIMQTAHEGRVLGERWSSLWVPLRLLFAVGLIVPVPGLGGYNLAQAGVAFVVKGSTNIASMIWATSAGLVVSGRVPVAAAPATVPDQVFRTMFKNAACMAIVNDQMRIAAQAAANLTEKEVTPLALVNVPAEAGGKLALTSAIQTPNGSVQSANICGSFSTPAPPDFIQKLADDEAGFGVEGGRKAQIGAKFVETHRAAMLQVQGQMNALAAGLLPLAADPGQQMPDISAELAQIKIEANRTLAAGIDEIVTDALGADRSAGAVRDRLLKRITGGCLDAGAAGGAEAACYGEGWIGAGSWYMMIAQLNNEISGLTDAAGSAEPGTYIRSPERAAREIYIASGGESGLFVRESRRARDAGMLTSVDEASLLMARYEQAFADSTAGLAALGFTMSFEDLADLNEDVTPRTLLNRIPGLQAKITEMSMVFINYFSPAGAGGTADPMIGLMMIGKYLTSASTALLMASYWFAPAMPIALAGLGAGGMLAYVLPIMPFFFWILAVTGYFLLIVEAVNLWGLAHMRMDGEGISGEAGRQGWLMLLSLMMTPVLMIFGFLVGMTIFRVTSALIGLGFSQALSGILGGDVFNSLIALLVYSALMSVIYMVVIERSFSLITELPARVLRWMGAHAEVD